jgi:hypothetical protein
LPHNTRVVVRFDHHPQSSDNGKIGVALYVARYYVGTMAIEDNVPIQEYVIWSARMKPLKNGRLSRHVWLKWKVIAMTIQRHVDTIPKAQLDDMLVRVKLEPLREITSRIIAETRRREALAKKGAVYNRGGWRVVHPLPTVWAVSIPDYIGVVTAVVEPESETIMVEAAQVTGSSKKFKATKLREGIIKGIQHLSAVAGRLMDVLEVEKIFDAAGIRNEMAGILDTKVHKYLSQVIVTLTDAAHDSGINGINTALKHLLSEVKVHTDSEAS